MNKNCLVTGGAGFIGHQVVKKLKELGHTVYVVDNLSTGCIENIEYAKPDYFYDDDICKINSVMLVAKMMEQRGHNLDWVFHLAALPRVQFSIANPLESHNANITGTLNIFEVARRHKADKVVFSSSSSVYGDQGVLPLREGMIPNPMSPYASQKLYGEQLAKQYNLHYGLDITCLRYFNVYGPRQKADSSYAAFIPKFIESYIKGERPTIFGDGNQTRDFTYVDDVVEANILGAQTPASFTIANIGAGNNQSVNDIDLMIREKIPSDDGPIYGDPVVEPRDTMACRHTAAKRLGWEPKTDIRTGLEKTINHFLEN